MMKPPPPEDSYQQMVQWMKDLTVDCQTHSRVYSEDVLELIRLVIKYLRDQGKMNEAANN